MHFRLCTASAVVAAPSSPERTSEVFRRPQSLVARDGTYGGGLPRLGVLAGWNDCVSTLFGDCIMALTGVVGAVGCDTGDHLIGMDLAQKFGQPARFTYVAAGDFDRPDLQRLFVDPEMDLAQTHRVAPPCFRAFHSPSPSTLMPVLSISRCSGPCDPRCGMFTASVFWRRPSVLKSGTSQCPDRSGKAGSRRTLSSA